MDLRTRRLITIHKELKWKVDIDRLYIKRNEKGSKFDQLGNCVDTVIQ